MRVIAAYIGVVLIWSTTPLAVKLSTDSLSFASAVGLRMATAAVICLLMMLAMGRLPRWHGAALRSYGAANIGVFGAMSLVYLASTHISSGLVSLIFGLAPMISGALAAPLLGEPGLTPRRVGILALALVGLAIVFNGAVAVEQTAWTGLLACLGAVLCFSLSSVLIKRGSDGLTPLEHTTGSLLFSLPLFGLSWWYFDGTLPQDISSTSLVSIVYLAVVGSVVGFVLYFFILQKLAATQVALIPLMTPVLALLLGAWAVGETITESTVMGGSLILLSLALFQGGARLAGGWRRWWPGQAAPRQG